MCEVRDLVNVTRRALDTYAQMAELERMAGACVLLANERARQTALREAINKLCELLECDPCDL